MGREDEQLPGMAVPELLVCGMEELCAPATASLPFCVSAGGECLGSLFLLSL